MAKRFRWRLESVKKAKEREEERRQEALAEARNALRAEEGKLAELRREQEATARKLREKQKGRLNPSDLALADAYQKELEKRARKQIGEVEKARTVSEQKREILLESVQENKALENLRGRAEKRHRKEVQRRDQAANDEAANRKSNRQDGTGE